MKKNTIIKVLLALLVTVGLYLTFKLLNPPITESGDKSIHLIVEVANEDQTTTIIFDQVIKTDTEILADLLLELDEKAELSVILTGNASDPYGRSLTAIAEYAIEDWASGPWWLYNSDTNPECLAASFCPGVDSCPIYDNDRFVFSFTSEFK